MRMEGATDSPIEKSKSLERIFSTKRSPAEKALKENTDNMTTQTLYKGLVMS